MTLSTFLLAAVLASNASGKTLVRQQQGALVSRPSAMRPVFSEDAATVSHVWFKAGQIADTKGLTWTMTGTVPQVARSGSTPAGAGVFADANYYSRGTGSDEFDFSTSYTCHALFSPPASFATFPVLVSAGDASTIGWVLQFTAGGAARIWANGQFADTVNTCAASALNVVSVGRAAGTSYVKLNLGTSVTKTAALTAATALVTKLGRFETTGLAFAGVLYEVVCSSTAWDEASVVSAQTAAKSKLGVTAW
jgi:hypothetical protein